ncbi:hypothetical protein SAMN04488118_11717 [Epibacterium ulvae]|uniref:Uncharacterized protein n=1 Tax=Epibacterium ulvae TaxID=1156985 RepID=A0A1G5RH66_9RHOB|nr:hypothetical protein SAMN04488118_11717 [Epibacterium ulvae]
MFNLFQMRLVWVETSRLGSNVLLPHNLKFQQRPDYYTNCNELHLSGARIANIPDFR